MKKNISEDEKNSLLATLQQRFEQNHHRHQDISWTVIENRLKSNPTKLVSLYHMEITGGEPDVIGFDQDKNTFLFCDCSTETPKNRRSICYDHKALESRKKHPPANSAENLATEIGIEILTEEEYRYLQSLESFDTKTSSWLKTPTSIRELGGAIFGDYRFGRAFVYHNGADSYYSARGFRGILRI